MPIPAKGVAAVELHKTHASLDHAPRHEATPAEVLRDRFVHPVKPPGGGAFTRDIHDFTRMGLHAVSQLVGRDAGGQR